MLSLSPLVFLLGIAAAAPSEAEAATPAPRHIAAATLSPERSIFSESERAAIASKCGYGANEWPGRNVRFEDGVLDCGNGRRVDDPEVRALMGQLRERVQVRVRNAMARVETRQAIDRRVRESLNERMRHFPAERRPHSRGRVLAMRGELGRDERARLRADMARLRADMRSLRHELRRHNQEHRR